MIKERTLVVDMSYQPVQIVCWQRAITLVLAARAEVLEEHHDVKIHTVSNEFPVPSIIRLRRNAVRSFRVRLVRSNIYRRDNFTCAYCCRRHPENFLSIDHIIPISRGGKRTWENLVTACRPCNSAKGNKTPEQAKMRLHYRPRSPTWNPAFFFNYTRKDPPSWGQFLRPEV